MQFQLENLLTSRGLLLAASLALALLLSVGRVPLRYNLRNLLVRWRITVLTALAFTVVIGLMTVMLAFVNGMAKLAEGSGRPGNVMVLADGATDELFSNLVHSDTSNLERERAEHDENGLPLPVPATVARNERGYLCSREVYIIVNQPVAVAAGQPARRRFVQVRGIVHPEIAAEVHGLELLPGGNWFSPARGGVQKIPGETREAIQAVLGEAVARELGKDRNKPSLEIGDVFELGDRQWVAVGLMKSAGSTFDSEIWGLHQLVGPMFRKENYTSIVLRAADDNPISARALACHVTKNFRPAVQAVPETEYYAKLQTTNQQFLYAIQFVTVIMAVGGVFGVMNTMFAAISQRTREIGVMRILGYARWQILVSFLLESLAIALLGGLLGCALGFLADGATATSILSSGNNGGKMVVLKLIVDGDIIAAGMLLALGMGVLGGLLPSLSAMRLKPLDAMH